MVKRVRAYYESAGYITAKELDLNYGRADLVAFIIDAEKVRSRLANNQHRSLSRVEHYSILRALPDKEDGKSIPLGQIAKNIPLSEQYIRSKLLSFLIHFLSN